MSARIVPVIPFERPDSQGRIIVPELLTDVADSLIVTKLRADVADKAFYLLGIIDPDSECGESMAARLGSLLPVRKIDAKRRLFIPKTLIHDPALSFLRPNNQLPLAMSLLPREGGIFAGREDDVISTQFRL